MPRMRNVVADAGGADERCSASQKRAGERAVESFRGDAFPGRLSGSVTRAKQQTSILDGFCIADGTG